MEIYFTNKKLLGLYENGKSSKYKLSKQTLKKFFMRVQQIESAESIHDLWKTPSLRFERLEGFINHYSIRVDLSWRLEFEIEWENKEKTKGKVFLKDISNHYGD